LVQKPIQNAESGLLYGPEDWTPWLTHKEFITLLIPLSLDSVTLVLISLILQSDKHLLLLFATGCIRVSLASTWVGVVATKGLAQALVVGPLNTSRSVVGP
jgi:hypothetical protein